MNESVRPLLFLVLLWIFYKLIKTAVIKARNRPQYNIADPMENDANYCNSNDAENGRKKELQYLENVRYYTSLHCDVVQCALDDAKSENKRLQLSRELLKLEKDKLKIDYEIEKLKEG